MHVEPIGEMKAKNGNVWDECGRAGTQRVIGSTIQLKFIRTKVEMDFIHISMDGASERQNLIAWEHE